MFCAVIVHVQGQKVVILVQNLYLFVLFLNGIIFLRLGFKLA